jgi:hypothetical protein
MTKAAIPEKTIAQSRTDGIANGRELENFWSMIPTVYDPTAKKAAWPKEMIPVYPISKLRLTAKRAIMSISETMFRKDNLGNIKGKTTRKPARKSNQMLDRMNRIAFLFRPWPFRIVRRDG